MKRLTEISTRGRRMNLSKTLREEQGNNAESIEVLLRQIVSRISENIKLEKIILFGSYAWGKPNEASDIDLFIVVPESNKRSYQRAQEVYRLLRGLDAPVEIIVQTKDEVSRNLKVTTSLAKKVLEEGRVLYG
jgi:predicted nucleotidyltransferase